MTAVGPGSDRALLYAAAFLRALATGLVGVLLGLYLARLSLGPAEIGQVVSAGLAGAASAALVVTLAGDRLGRRRTLLALGVLGTAGGLAASLAAGLSAVVAAAFVGMLNGQGRDRGASLVLEQAILPATATEAGRTRAFAWYNVLQDAGHALGGLLAALPELLRAEGANALPSLRLAMAGYAALLLLSALCYLPLCAAVERAESRPRLELSAPSRRVLTRISLLFGLDSLAGGFLGTALIAYFFHARYGASESTIALLFLGARVANALSHLGAAWLARRIGLVNTMVFTHVPSSLLLMTVPLAPDFATAAVLFLLREGLVEMDVPTRQSYVMAVVRPEERTLASGVTHLVRLGGWAVAPAFAGVLMQHLALGSPLVVGGLMKIAYDGLLWRSFRHLKPPEETPGVG
jgi:predicted MFS family arabinose efflux permease